MQKLNPTHCAFVSILLILGLSAISHAQERTLPEDEFYGDVKRILMSHYTGKTVRTKLPIPATRRGLEMIDGALQNRAEKTPPETAAAIGDELTIKSFRVTDSNIEVLLAKNDAAAVKKRLPNPFGVWKQPRINIRFTRELNAKDLTIENINRLLSPAVDVGALTPPPGEKPPAGAPAEKRARTDAPIAQTMPGPEISIDMPVLGPSVGELKIDAPVKEARIYIDGSFSGATPRILRVRAGLHTILVLKDGFRPWEQRLFIPGAKSSVIQVELEK
jgi:hypothetical protein